MGDRAETTSLDNASYELLLPNGTFPLWVDLLYYKMEKGGAGKVLRRNLMLEPKETKKAADAESPAASSDVKPPAVSSSVKWPEVWEAKFPELSGEVFWRKIEVGVMTESLTVDIKLTIAFVVDMANENPSLLRLLYA